MAVVSCNGRRPEGPGGEGYTEVLQLPSCKKRKKKKDLYLAVCFVQLHSYPLSCAELGLTEKPDDTNTFFFNKNVICTGLGSFLSAL